MGNGQSGVQILLSKSHRFLSDGRYGGIDELIQIENRVTTHNNVHDDHAPNVARRMY